MTARHFCLSVLLVLASANAPACAQMMLPGAMNGNRSDSAPKSGGGGGGGGAPSYTPPKPIVIKPPAEDTIIGHTLSYDGSKGAMSFDRSGNDIVLSKLTLTGDKISKAGEACSVDVSTAPPVTVSPAGRPVGTIRFTVPVPACPLTVDVLDGAALVSVPDTACEFTAADCRVAPGGLWGPHAADITPKQAKDLERQRVRFETTMRANFRALLKKAGKDRAAVKAFARDQAAFSSDRETVCRDYEQESTHGFCSTQVTQARVLALLALFGETPEGPHDRKSVSRIKVKPARPKPVAASPAEPPVDSAPAAEAR